MLSSTFAGALGATLLHSLWQGVVVALALFTALSLMRKTRAAVRFSVILGAMAVLAGWSGVTFWQEWEERRAAESRPLVQLVLPDFSQALNAPVGQLTVSSPTVWPVERPSLADVWEQRLMAALEPVHPYLAHLWMAGMLLFLLRWMGGLWYLNRYRGPMSEPVSADIQLLADHLSHRLGLRRMAEVRLSAAAQVPFVLGFFRPLVVLPLELATGLTPAQLEAVLAHELGHLRRYDFILNLLVSLLESFFFYHPAFWWMAARLNEEREHACDDLVVSLLDRRQYAEALYRISALEKAANQRLQPSLAPGLFSNKQELLSRIKRIMLCDNPKRSMNRFLPLSLFTLALFAFFWLTPARSLATNVRDAVADLVEDLNKTLVPENPAPAEKQRTSQTAATEPVSLLSSLREALLNIAVTDTPPPAPVAPVAPVPPISPDDVMAPLPPMGSVGPLPPMPPAPPADSRRFRVDSDGDGIAEVDIAYNFDLDRTLAQMQADLERAHAQIQTELERIRRNRELTPRQRADLEDQLERAGEQIEDQMEQAREQMEAAIEREREQRERMEDLRTQRREIQEAERQARAEAMRAEAEARRIEAEMRAEAARQQAEAMRASRQSANSGNLYEQAVRGLAEKDGLINPGAKIVLDIDEKTVSVNGKKLNEEQSLPYLSVTRAFIGQVKPGSTVVFEYQR